LIKSQQPCAMQLPDGRGPLSDTALTLLRGGSAVLPQDFDQQVLDDSDFQLALWCCYELHYRGFDGVADEREWDPRVLEFRALLEARFLSALRDAVEVEPVESVGDIPAMLVKLVADDDGPPLSLYLQRSATVEQFREFVQHRSLYHLKEADPHSWAIPRLHGRAKAALIEIQSDEYGGGSLERMHSQLFRQTMRGLGLTDGYGDYLNRVPGVTLVISNLMSMFGLHRRWRGAIAGHLAVFEMTSSIPNRRYARGIRRLGGDDSTARFYDEHVEADAVHEQIAAYDLCGSLAEDEPALAQDIVFGAAAALYLDASFGGYLLDRWSAAAPTLL
jgi:hypothetical protein